MRKVIFLTRLSNSFFVFQMFLILSTPPVISLLIHLVLVWKDTFRVGHIYTETATGSILWKKVFLRCFPVNFEKYLRTPFFIEHLQWLFSMSERTMLQEECSNVWIKLNVKGKKRIKEETHFFCIMCTSPPTFENF